MKGCTSEPYPPFQCHHHPQQQHPSSGIKSLLDSGNIQNKRILPTTVSLLPPFRPLYLAHADYIIHFRNTTSSEPLLTHSQPVILQAGVLSGRSGSTTLSTQVQCGNCYNRTSRRLVQKCNSSQMFTAALFINNGNNPLFMSVHFRIKCSISTQWHIVQQ